MCTYAARMYMAHMHRCIRYGAKRHGPNHPCLILSWGYGGNPTTHNQAKRPSLIKERQPAPNLGPHGAPIPPTQNCTPHGASPHRAGCLCHNYGVQTKTTGINLFYRNKSNPTAFNKNPTGIKLNATAFNFFPPNNQIKCYSI